MTKQSIIAQTVKTMNQLPADKVREIYDFSKRFVGSTFYK
jgi:hypothetical protein